MYNRVLHGYDFLYPDPTRWFFSVPGPEPDPTTVYPDRTGPGRLYPDPNRYPANIFKDRTLFKCFCFSYEKKNILLNFIHKQQWRRDYLRFSKKTSESSESGFSCCFLASKTRPASLNIRSRVEDEAGTESSGDAKHDNCGYIHECFFYHSNTSSPAW